MLNRRCEIFVLAVHHNHKFSTRIFPKNVRAIKSPKRFHGQSIQNSNLLLHKVKLVLSRQYLVPETVGFVLQIQVTFRQRLLQNLQTLPKTTVEVLRKDCVVIEVLQKGVHRHEDVLRRELLTLDQRLEGSHPLVCSLEAGHNVTQLLIGTQLSETCILQGGRKVKMATNNTCILRQGIYS